MKMPADYVAMDLETTGLNPRLDKIIEIGAVKVREGEMVDTFCTYVNPGRSIPERITRLTGIGDEEVKDAPFIEEVMTQFLEFLGEDCLLGHNIIFDYSFIKKAAVNQKLTFERQGMDTLRIARRFLPELESRNLGFLCRYYEIPLEEAHRAYHDAMASHLLYRRLCGEFYEKEETVFWPKQLIYSVKKETPITPRQKGYLLDLTAKYRIPVEDDRIILPPILAEKLGERPDIGHMTKNEASRLIDCILGRARELNSQLLSDDGE